MTCGGFQIKEIRLEAPLPRMFDEVRGFLEKGIRACVLNDHGVVKKMPRELNGLKKDDENDAAALEHGLASMVRGAGPRRTPP